MRGPNQTPAEHVQTWVQTAALDWLLARADVDFQLMLFIDATGALLAIGAHERLSEEQPPGTFIRFIALAVGVQQAEIPTDPPEPDGHACRLSTHVFRAIIEDAHTRGRGDLFALFVEVGNELSLGMCGRMGFTLDPDNQGESEFALIATIP